MSSWSDYAASPAPPLSSFCVKWSQSSLGYSWHKRHLQSLGSPVLEETRRQQPVSLCGQPITDWQKSVLPRHKAWQCEHFLMTGPQNLTPIWNWAQIKHQKSSCELTVQIQNVKAWRKHGGAPSWDPQNGPRTTELEWEPEFPNFCQPPGYPSTHMGHHSLQESWYEQDLRKFFRHFSLD